MRVCTAAQRRGFGPNTVCDVTMGGADVTNIEQASSWHVGVVLVMFVVLANATAAGFEKLEHYLRR